MSIESSGSGLLLRLFESSFFNVHLAVGYLKTYPNSIGITHYLVRRLRSFDAREVEFYWPQLCYLIITRPTPSVALENFILERCELDPHIAVITLWYFQSSLSDLYATPNTPQFDVCRRIYNRVQAIIFTDPPIPSTSDQTSKGKGKVDAALASFVGLGMMAASVGIPGLVEVNGQMAVEQGRRVEDTERDRLMKGDEDDDRSESGSEEDALKKSEVEAKALEIPVAGPSTLKVKLTRKGPKRSQTQPSYVPGAPLEISSPTSSSHPPPSSSQLSRSPYLPSIAGVRESPTSPNSTFADQQQSNGWHSSNHLPLTQSARIRSPRYANSGSPISLSVPSLPVASTSASYLIGSSRLTTSTSQTGSTLPGYGFPKEFLSHLLLLQSCRSQLDLLRSLQDISTRLVVVPKPARLSSLRAELTVLNHGLPRGCCLGMSCSGSSFPSTKGSSCRAHDRIVRISPSESAVLNSADRAPFVIHVEVLEGDLDFDPDRRQNTEDLRRALKERESGVGGGFGERNGAGGHAKGRMSLESGMDRASSSNGYEDDGRPSPRGWELRNGTDTADNLGEADMGSSRGEVVPREMDLVEQLYGDVSIHEAPMRPIRDDDPSIQNRSVDEQAWARIHDLQESADSSRSASPSTLQVVSAASVPSSPSPASLPSTPIPKPGGRLISNRAPISLDQYAERMRMAAIMLAQLDASQAATIGVVATGTAAAGTLVALPVVTVVGIGGVVGGVVGIGLAKISAPFLRRDVQPGQASTGVATSLNTASAAAGISSVAGAPPLPHSSANLVPSGSSKGGIPNQRQRVLLAAEATAIRERIMSEMLALEEERMERMRLDGKARSGWATGGGIEDGAVVMRAVNKEDPSGAVFRESFASKTSRIRAASPYGHLASWNVISVIVKTGADLRQEQLAIQLIKEFGRIWKEENCPAWVRYFRILVTSESSGLIETITDAVSVHSIKKDAYARTAADGTQIFTSFTLLDHYVEAYGSVTSSAFRKAQNAFVSSLASYSVICYLLQLKDRHNGNILVDRDGHLIHIDFGFMLSNSPGSLGFEMAPFKLPHEYIDVLGGFESDKFIEFKVLFKRAFRAARKHAERIITLVELMQKDSNLPCFANGISTSQQLRERFQLTLTTSQVDDFVDKLIISAATSSFTRLYDLFQGYSNGIL